MRYIKEILSKNKLLVSAYIAIGIFNSFLVNYKADYFQKVIDDLSEGNITLGSVLFYGVILITGYCMGYVDVYPSNKLEHGLFLDFKILALQKISRIDYSEYQGIGTGKLVQRIENGAEAGKNLLCNFWLRLFRELLPTILFSVYFIWNINRMVTYVMLGGYVIVFIITNILLKGLYQIKEKILSGEEQMNHYLVRGFMEMLVFRMERQFRKEIGKASGAREEIVRSKVKMSMIHEAFFTIFALLVALLNIGILLYAWHSREISVGSTVALLALLENAYTPIAIFNVLYVQYKLDITAFQRFGEFLECKDDAQLAHGKDVPRLRGNIVFEHVTFRYGEHMIIKDLNLTIRGGEKVAFVGESGSGKSTLVKLLAGLLKYEEGSIRIDSLELRELCLSSLYEQLSYISQEPPVFDGTLRENLVFDEEVPDDEQIEALRRVQLLPLFSGLPQGLDTRIGERGTILSGGERQRVALARLWFEKKKITILDEATSALDNLTEEAVMEEVNGWLHENTVIAIAHRLNSIAHFDRIIVFRQGKIAGQGTFEKLMEDNAYFVNLYHASVR